jgi:hypothetical protein
MRACMSRASVGWATAFGCTVVSTTTRSKAPLQERFDLLLAQALTPARH